MARSSWNGSVQFSLINLPVKLISSIDDDKMPLHMVRKSDGSRIKFRKVADNDGQEVPYGEVGKGYVTGDGTVVQITEEDFAEAYGNVGRVAEILMVTDGASIPDIAKEKPYYIMPDNGTTKKRKTVPHTANTAANKSYTLLAAALRRSGKVAIVEFAMRDRKRLAVLSATDDGYLVLQQLVWAEDIRTPDFEAPAADVTDDELAMASELLESMSGDYNHSDYQDDSRGKLEEIVMKKLESGNVSGPATVPVKDNSEAQEDLMSQLMASVEASRKKINV